MRYLYVSQCFIWLQLKTTISIHIISSDFISSELNVLWSDPVCHGCNQNHWQDSATYFGLTGHSHGELGRFTAHLVQMKWNEMRWIWMLFPSCCWHVARSDNCQRMTHTHTRPRVVILAALSQRAASCLAVTHRHCSPACRHPCHHRQPTPTRPCWCYNTSTTARLVTTVAQRVTLLPTMILVFETRKNCPRSTIEDGPTPLPLAVMRLLIDWLLPCTHLAMTHWRHDNKIVLLQLPVNIQP